jgi:hypothetical protein
LPQLAGGAGCILLGDGLGFFVGLSSSYLVLLDALDVPGVSKRTSRISQSSILSTSKKEHKLFPQATSMTSLSEDEDHYSLRDKTTSGYSPLNIRLSLLRRSTILLLL